MVIRPIDVVERLDVWVNLLASPLLPPNVVQDGEGSDRLEFRFQNPHAVMIGKLVRAVSGVRAAYLLAENGYVAECASLLRIVNDICTEIMAIGSALNREPGLSTAVSRFVNDYYEPVPRTLEQHLAAERKRYMSRKELMKEAHHLLKETEIAQDKLMNIESFLNHQYNSYVHGAYHTTMELYDPVSCAFAMRGYPRKAKRLEFIEAVHLMLHAVVSVIEITAALTATEQVYREARDTRREMDTSQRWKCSNPERLLRETPSP